MLGRPCAVACALGLWLGGAAGQEWPALELYGLPYLRDCGESNFVRPIDAFCRKSFRPEELFAGAPQPLIFSVGPLRTIAEGRGALAHVRIEGTLHANVADLWFDAFFTGPALLRATVLERRRGAYEFSARAFDAGVYSLELTLMWENRTFAFSPVLGEQPDVASVIKLRSAENARHRHNAPLCRPLRVVGDTGAPPFRVAEVSVSGPPLPRALPLCAPYGSPRYDAGERADWGRWVNLSHPETRRAFEPLARPAAIAVNGTGGTAKRRLQASAARGCELAWAPSSCAMRRYGAAELDSCVDAGVRLQLVGDSNMRCAAAPAHWLRCAAPMRLAACACAPGKACPSLLPLFPVRRCALCLRVSPRPRCASAAAQRAFQGDLRRLSQGQGALGLPGIHLHHDPGEHARELPAAARVRRLAC